MLTVTAPAVWPKLLEIEDLEEYDGPLPAKRDDCQRVGSEPDSEGRSVELELCSGGTNYWYTVNVWQNGELIGQSEPDHSLCAGNDETETDDGQTVKFKVILK